jgi:hypothetical protein
MAKIFLYVEKEQTLIFARTKRGTERLAKNLIREGFTAAMIQGDRSQSQRIGALNRFEEGKFQVLVATDVASRGIQWTTSRTSSTTTCRKFRETSSTEWAATVAWAPEDALDVSLRRGNRRAAFDGTCTQIKNRSPAIGRRHANTATGSPEHPSNAYAVPNGRRSILVNSTELRNAYNECVSHVRDGFDFPFSDGRKKA